MNNQKYSIAIAAVLFAAALAGIMFICDEDVSAVEGETQEYTVTYSYDGFVFSEKTTNGKLNVKEFNGPSGALVSASVPEGYAFDYWVAGSAIYAPGATDVQFAGDTVLTPVFKANAPILKLIFDSKVGEYILAVPVPDESAPSDIAMDYPKDVAQLTGETTLEKFAKLIGAEVLTVEKVADESNAKTYTANGLFIKGLKFDGFALADDKERTIVGDFSRVITKDKTVTAYVAVFEPVYNVTFNVEGADTLTLTSDKIVLNNVDAKDGTPAQVRSIPVAPAKENYIFMGWYNAAGEKVIGYSVDKDEYTYAVKDFKFTSGVTLFAKFVPLTYTVTFVYGEDAKVFETETVKYGEKAIEPKALPAGYKGWDFDFKNPILQDTTIVAVEADPVTVYNVVFEVEGKAPITQKSDSMVLPDTTREGYVFQGWLVKGETGYVDPMKYDIQSDITFVAVYKIADPPAGPGFFETNEGKCVAVIIGVALLAFIYAVYTNMFGMKDLLTSFKIQRVKKE